MTDIQAARGLQGHNLKLIVDILELIMNNKKKVFKVFFMYVILSNGP